MICGRTSSRAAAVGTVRQNPRTVSPSARARSDQKERAPPPGLRSAPPGGRTAPGSAPPGRPPNRPPAAPDPPTIRPAAWLDFCQNSDHPSRGGQKIGVKKSPACDYCINGMSLLLRHVTIAPKRSDTRHVTIAAAYTRKRAKQPEPPHAIFAPRLADTKNKQHAEQVTSAAFNIL